MTCKEHERLYELVQNPPPGSKMEAAKEYGVDLTLNLRSLTRTPTERIREMEAALKFAEEWRRAAAHLDLEYTGGTRSDLGWFHRSGTRFSPADSTEPEHRRAQDPDDF